MWWRWEGGGGLHVCGGRGYGSARCDQAYLLCSLMATTSTVCSSYSIAEGPNAEGQACVYSTLLHAHPHAAKAISCCNGRPASPSKPHAVADCMQGLVAAMVTLLCSLHVACKHRSLAKGGVLPRSPIPCRAFPHLNKTTSPLALRCAFMPSNTDCP
jgi:hypothetical protein